MQERSTYFALVHLIFAFFIGRTFWSAIFEAVGSVCLKIAFKEDAETSVNVVVKVGAADNLRAIELTFDGS